MNEQIPLLEQYRLSLSLRDKYPEGNSFTEDPRALASSLLKIDPSLPINELANVNTINNAVIYGQKKGYDWKDSTTSTLKDAIGGNFVGDVVSEAAGNIVKEAPTLALSVALGSQRGLPAAVTAAGLFGLSSQQAFNETADPDSAALAGATNLASVWLGQGVASSVNTAMGAQGTQALLNRVGSQFVTDRGFDLLDMYNRPTVEQTSDGHGVVNLDQEKGFGPESRFAKNVAIYENPVILGGMLLTGGIQAGLVGAGAHRKQLSQENVDFVKGTNKDFLGDNYVGGEHFPLDAASQAGAATRMPLDANGNPMLRSISSLRGDEFFKDHVGDSIMRSKKVRTNMEELSQLKERLGAKSEFIPVNGIDDADTFTALRFEKTPLNLVEDFESTVGKKTYVIPKDESLAKTLSNKGLDVTILSPREMLVSNVSNKALPALASGVKMYGGKKQVELFSTVKKQAPYIDEITGFSSLKTYLLGQGNDNTTAISQLRYLKNAGADLRSMVVEYSGDKRVAGFYDPNTRIVGLNKKAQAMSAFHTLAHETAHDTYQRVSRVKPRMVKMIEDYVDALPVESRRFFLGELSDVAGLSPQSKTIALDYGSDPTKTLRALSLPEGSVDVKKVQAMEFSGKVMELLSVISEKQPAKLPKFLELLPTEMVSFFFDTHSALRGMFKTNKPDLSALLPADISEGTRQVVKRLGKALYNQESANQTFLRSQSELSDMMQGKPVLKNLSAFNIDNDAPKIVKDTHDVSFALAAEGVDKIRKQKTGMNRVLANYAVQQLVSTIHPVTHPVFDMLSRFVPSKTETIAKVTSYLSNKENLTTNERNAHVNRMFVEIRDNPAQLKLLGKLFKYNNEALAAKLPILTPAEAKAKGLGETGLVLFERLPKVLKLVLQEKIDKTRQQHSNNLGSLLWALRGDLTLKQVDEVQRAVLNAQSKLYPAFNKALVDSGLGSVKRLFARGEGDASMDTVASMNILWKLPQFDEVKQHFKKLGYGLADDTLSPSQAKALKAIYTIDANAYHVIGRMLVHFDKEGYTTMVRGGRYRVKAWEGEDVKIYRDFDNEKDALKYKAELQKKYGPDNVDAYDTDMPERFGESFKSKTLTEATTKARRGIQESLAEIIQDSGFTPQQKALFAPIFEQAGKSFRPLEAEMTEALQRRPEKFFKHRNLIGGFREESFIPSAMTYIESVLGDSQRNVTRSAIELLLRDPTYDSGLVPSNLREFMEAKTRYVLDGKQWEASGIRKFMYFHTLVGSMANFSQNLAQPTFTMLPVLIQEHNGNVFKAMDVYRKAMAEVVAYNWKGKSPTAFVSNMLRTAENSGVYNPRAMDVLLDGKHEAFFASSGTKGANFVKNFAATVSDKMGWIARETERFNRQVGFAAGVIAAHGKGLRNVNEIFQAGRRLTDDANFVGSKANRPKIFADLGKAHGVALTAMTLRMFSYNVMNQLIGIGATALFPKKYGRSAITGKSFEGRAGSLMALGYVASALGLAAGVQGLPFVGDVNNAIMSVVGDKDILLEGQRMLREYLQERMDDDREADVISDAIFTGIPGALGIEASSRLGYGNMLGIRSNAPDSISSFIGTLVGGASLNIADKLGDAAGKTAENFIASPDRWFDNITEGMSLAAPAAINQITKYKNGVFGGLIKNARTGALIYERPEEESISSKGQLALGFGFEPSEISDEKTRNYLTNAMEQKQADMRRIRYEGLADTFIRAQKSGNLENPSAAFNAIADLKSEPYGSADESDIVTNILNKVNAKTSAASGVPTQQKAAIWKRVDGLVPSTGAREVLDPLSQLTLRLEIAQKFELNQHLLELVSQLGQQFPKAVSDRALLQMGLTPDILRKIEGGAPSDSLGLPYPPIRLQR